MLAAGLLGGCGSRPEPAPAEPPAMTTPEIPPLPLPEPLPPTGPTRVEPGLGTEDLARLTEARRVGARWVVLLVVTEPARTAEVSAELEQLGGVLGTTSPDVESLRLTMPTDQVERAAALPGISAVDVEQVVAPNYPRPTG
ncbi:MAG: hypothetical protein ACRDTE_05060 [Pseudonocardiaceae bacterium]